MSSARVLATLDADVGGAWKRLPGIVRRAVADVARRRGRLHVIRGDRGWCEARGRFDARDYATLMGAAFAPVPRSRRGAVVTWRWEAEPCSCR